MLATRAGMKKLEKFHIEPACSTCSEFEPKHFTCTVLKSQPFSTMDTLALQLQSAHSLLARFLCVAVHELGTWR